MNKKEVNSRKILEQNRSKGRHGCEYDKVEYIVFDSVFSPGLFNAHKVFTPALEACITKPGSFLEIGAGCGITGLHLFSKHKIKSLLLTDINPSATSNCHENIRKMNIKEGVEVIESDLFEDIPESKFDIIYWNYPWIFKEKDYIYRDELERGLFDPGYCMLERYITQASDYLSENGRLFIGFGCSGDYSRLKAITTKHNKKLKKMESKASLEVESVVFTLYEIVDNT